MQKIFTTLLIVLAITQLNIGVVSANTFMTRSNLVINNSQECIASGSLQSCLETCGIGAELVVPVAGIIASRVQEIIAT